MIETAGDYQTETRMRAKLSAIPLPEDFSGLSVLDIGCDHGAFTKLAADRGAESVLGLDRGRGVRRDGRIVHRDIVERNRAQGWDRCTFEVCNLGSEWPEFGQRDVVFAFSVYHHVFQECGDHVAIWAWLAKHVAPGGVLLFEGPIDTRDPIAKSRARGQLQPYTRNAILTAAGEHFDVEYYGPAVHRDHREVWVCRPWDRTGRVRSRVPSLSTVAPDGPPLTFRDGGVSGDAQPGDQRERGTRRARRAPASKRARKQDRAAPMVGRTSHVWDDRRAGADREGGDVAVPVPGTRGGNRIPGLRHPEWGRGHVVRSRALVLGGGECVWSDLARLEEVFGAPWDGIIIAVNDIGVHLPHVDYWASKHPEKLFADRQYEGGLGWIDQRKQIGLPCDFETVSDKKSLTDHKLHGGQVAGSSGMVGVLWALQVCDAPDPEIRVPLAGMPMDRQPHFQESRVHRPGKPWSSCEAHWRPWTKGQTGLYFAGRVRSFSGRTRDTFGEPSMTWLRGEEE